MKQVFFLCLSVTILCMLVQCKSSNKINVESDNIPIFWSIAHANSLIARFPDPDNIPFRAWCYSQGYILEGFEKLAELTGETKYHEYVKRYVDQRIDSVGNIKGFRGDHLDDYMAGVTIVAAYKQNGDSKYKLAADRMLERLFMVSRNTDGGFWHADSIRWPHRSHEMWIDGVFMGQMFTIRYGQFIGESEKCFNEATQQIIILANNCRKGNTGLFYHGYDENKNAVWADPETGLSPEVWSEGLGWYALILIETLDALPLNHKNRTAVLDIYKELAEGLKRTQDEETGMWYQVVDKGYMEDNWLESSGTGMFIYALQRGIDLNILDKNKFELIVQKAYSGLLKKVRINPDYGLIDIYDACDGLGVQKSYNDYVNFPKRINGKETLGSFLWASIAVEKPSKQN